MVTGADPAEPGSGRGAATADLREQLIELIAAEGLGPGERVPAEVTLASRLGVSRSKVREALKRLEEEGRLYAVQGLGRFVSPSGSLHVERPITVYESITEMLSGRGRPVTTSVLSVEEVGAGKEVAVALDVAEDAPIIRLTRLRLSDDEPLVFSVNSIVRDALPGPVRFRDWTVSLTEALEAHGHRIVSSAARISAIDLPADVAARYDLAQFDPWLLVEETCITADGVRVMHALDYHRGSEIAFNVLRRR
jgi:GntR family transcriptional regulator